MPIGCRHAALCVRAGGVERQTVAEDDAALAKRPASRVSFVMTGRPSETSSGPPPAVPYRSVSAKMMSSAIVDAPQFRRPRDQPATTSRGHGHWPIVDRLRFVDVDDDDAAARRSCASRSQQVSYTESSRRARKGGRKIARHSGDEHRNDPAQKHQRRRVARGVSRFFTGGITSP